MFKSIVISLLIVVLMALYCIERDTRIIKNEINKIKINKTITEEINECMGGRYRRAVSLFLCTPRKDGKIILEKFKR